MFTLMAAWQAIDAAIRARIVEDYRRFGRTWCPHTATAAELYARLPSAEKRRPWVLVATAHAAKFADVVEPLLQSRIELPENLARLMQMPSHCTDIDPSLASLARALDAV